MSEEPSKNEASSGSQKYLVRILLLVAIGVPVILEFLTFFNLIKFRLWDGEKRDQQEQVQKTEHKVREFSVGDTLFAESSVLITLQDMHIYVSPKTWKFEMKLRVMGASQDFKFSIDSLGLENGERVPVEELSEHETEEESGTQEIEGEWTIPNREVPNELFITIHKRASADSVAKIHKRVPISKPVVRYHHD